MCPHQLTDRISLKLEFNAVISKSQYCVLKCASSRHSFTVKKAFFRDRSLVKYRQLECIKLYEPTAFTVGNCVGGLTKLHQKVHHVSCPSPVSIVVVRYAVEEAALRTSGSSFSSAEATVAVTYSTLTSQVITELKLPCCVEILPSQLPIPFPPISLLLRTYFRS